MAAEPVLLALQEAIEWRVRTVVMRPSSVKRSAQADARRLARHQPTTLGQAARDVGLDQYADQVYCRACRTDTWPCPELLDLLDVYQLQWPTSTDGNTAAGQQKEEPNVEE